MVHYYNLSFRDLPRRPKKSFSAFAFFCIFLTISYFVYFGNIFFFFLFFVCVYKFSILFFTPYFVIFFDNSFSSFFTNPSQFFNRDGTFISPGCVSTVSTLTISPGILQFFLLARLSLIFLYFWLIFFAASWAFFPGCRFAMSSRSSTVSVVSTVSASFGSSIFTVEAI